MNSAAGSLKGKKTTKSRRGDADAILLLHQAVDWKWSFSHQHGITSGLQQCRAKPEGFSHGSILKLQHKNKLLHPANLIHG